MRYGDLGGIEEVLADIRELIEEPLQNPEVRPRCCPALGARVGGGGGDGGEPAPSAAPKQRSPDVGWAFRAGPAASDTR